MIKNLSHLLNGSLSVIFYFVNTVFWATPIFLLSVCKLIPIAAWQRFITYLLDGCATAWISVNYINQQIFSRTSWQVSGLDQLSQKTGIW